MPVFYECGICDHLHPWEFRGDCREDASRFTADQLDVQYGPDNWEQREMWERVAADMGELSARDLFQEYRLDCDDLWGTTMGWWFAVAAELWERGLPIPTEWQYRPSPIGARDPDAFETAYCAAATDDALRLFGRAMNRYAGMLKKAGKDY